VTTKITTAYNTTLTHLSSIFPTKTRIPNAYNLASNAQQYLDDGYGLAIDAKDFVDGEWCSMLHDFTFNVILARKMFKNDSDPVMFDTLVLALHEDVVTLQKDFYNVDRLSIPTSIDNLKLGPVGTIEEVAAGKFNILSIKIPMIITIREAL
jgi:hypothetical protein